MNAVEARNLGKRYRDTWALHDCDLAIPAGHIVAVVGPNGAGKTTLLHCAVGLCIPTTGTISVLGGTIAGSQDALDQVGFVAQDAPLHKQLTVASMVEVTQNLNERFDVVQAKERLNSLEIPLQRKIGKLSGGQQSQLALTLSLARSPSLLVLDEPLARLDPLARHAPGEHPGPHRGVDDHADPFTFGQRQDLVFNLTVDQRIGRLQRLDWRDRLDAAQLPGIELETPICRTRPRSFSAAMAAQPSSISSSGTGQWIW